MDRAKTELVFHENYADVEDARQSISEYIEVFYNCERLHSSLDRKSPKTFEGEYVA